MKKLLILLSTLLLIIQGCLNRQSPVDYIDTDVFEIVGECRTTGYAEDVALSDSSIAYVASGIAGIEVVSYLNPYNPEIVGYADTMSEQNIVRVTVLPESDLLLSVNSGKKVSFWNISDVTKPLWATSHMSDRTEGIFVWGEEKTGSKDSIIVFAADRDDGLKVNGFYWGFDIFQTFETWWAIEEIGYEKKVRGWPRFVTVDDSLVFLASDQTGIDIFRLNDIYNEDIEFIHNVDTPGSARCLTVVDTLIYVADGKQGLAIISGSTHDHMFYRGSVPTDGYSQWVTVFQDYLLLADGDNGLLLFSLTDPLKPKLEGKISLSYVNSIKTQGDYIFVADEYRGLIILALKS